MDERAPVRDLYELQRISEGLQEPVWMLTDSSKLMLMPYAVLSHLVKYKLIEVANTADIANFARHNPTELRSNLQTLPR